MNEIKYIALFIFSGLILSVYLTIVTKNIDYYNFFSAFIVGVVFITLFNFRTENRRTNENVV